jgi:hypothetical protein
MKQVTKYKAFHTDEHNLKYYLRFTDNEVLTLKS